jgi:PAS domain S-box-containing protein
MNKSLNILLVEDLDSDADLLEYKLKKSGFNYKIRRVENEVDYKNELNNPKLPDIILADYSLPSFSGLKALSIIKSINEDVPFILVTGTQSEEVAVDCIKKGADDYVLKSSLKRLPSAIMNALSTAEIKKQKKLIENELIKSEEKYRLITEKSRDLIALVDDEGKCLYASPSHLEVLGYSPDELIGGNLFDFIHPDDVQSVFDKWVESKNKNEGKDAIFRYKHKNGKWMIFEARGNWITEGRDTEKKAVLVSRDITQMINAQENLRRERDYNKRIIEETPAIVCGISPTGITRFINGSASRITGYKADELIGKNWHVIFYPGELYGQVDKFFEDYNKGDVKDYEMNLLTKNGELKTISWHSISKFNEQNELEELIGFGYNITERKLAEEKILNSLKEKELLIKEIHHRVKNNLQVISSIFYLQSEKVNDSILHGIINECRNRVNSMALIHENFYQSEDLTKIDFKEYLGDLVNNLEVSIGHENSSLIKIHLHVDSILLSVDTAIPCGLLINELVSNCFKHAFPHGRQGNIWIEMRKESEQNFKLMIKDDGIGLPDNFDFKNTKNLGMEIVTTLTEQLEGDIRFLNQNGTEFILNLKT